MGFHVPSRMWDERHKNSTSHLSLNTFHVFSKMASADSKTASASSTHPDHVVRRSPVHGSCVTSLSPTTSVSVYPILFSVCVQRCSLSVRFLPSSQMNCCCLWFFCLFSIFCLPLSLFCLIPWFLILFWLAPLIVCSLSMLFSLSRVQGCRLPMFLSWLCVWSYSFSSYGPPSEKYTRYTVVSSCTL